MINLTEILTVHRKSGTDKAYFELIRPITDPWKNIDDIIDFVRRWNKRVPIGRNKESIKKTILNLKPKLIQFQSLGLESFEFNEKNETSLFFVFDVLSKTALKTVGTTKLLHGLYPNLFVMWDKGICKKYGCYENAAGYVIFLKLMQELAQSLLREKDKESLTQETGVTIPKLIDEYNWHHFSTSKMFK